MSEVHEVDPDRPERHGPAIAAAAEALRSGRPVVFPTETVYAIAAAPGDQGATESVFVAKRRPSGLNLPVLVPDPGTAWDLADPSAVARSLAAAHWPGPLTMILQRSERSGRWTLGDRPDTIGLRVPDHPMSAALLATAGPLAATSANISGRPPLADAAGLREAFGEQVAVYLVLAPGAPAPSGRPSTVVDLTGPQPRVLREGPIDAHAISEAVEAGSEGSSR